MVPSVLPQPACAGNGGAAPACSLAGRDVQASEPWPARARRWHGAWQDHRAAVARVAGCVTRQRISFRLFKLWYWGSFDEEIQARRPRATL
jgi:hypothetical protein